MKLLTVNMGHVLSASAKFFSVLISTVLSDHITIQNFYLMGCYGMHIDSYRFFQTKYGSHIQGSSWNC
jgi:hypothetical protein